MKRLLFITALINSISTFSQEKGAQCKSECSLTYHHGTETDLFQIKGFFFDLAQYTEAFEQSTQDTMSYEISINEGDSLIYNADFVFEVCPGGIGQDDLDSVLLVLEGDPVPLTKGWNVTSYSGDHFWQTGVIKSPGLFRFRDDYRNSPENTYLMRVTMKELATPEISINQDWVLLSYENSLTIKTANETAVVSVTIYSLSGQLIRQALLEGTTALDLSALPKGCFIVHATDRNGIEKSLKFVK
ncbi:hypothetical protein D3C71_543270 [compost metagenome]